MHALQVFDEAVRAPTRDFWQVLIVIFMLELVLNMTAYWGWEFWGDGWHLFDAFIIFLCVMELILPEDMPGVKQMRVLKTLRILRVFKRLEKLRLLINSLLSSLGPLSHAFLIMLILFAIFSTVGVEMFHLVCTHTHARACTHTSAYMCMYRYSRRYLSVSIFSGAVGASRQAPVWTVCKVRGLVQSLIECLILIECLMEC